MHAPVTDASSKPDANPDANPDPRAGSAPVRATAPAPRPAKLSGKVFIIFLIGVWVAVIAGVTFMIVSFKQGGVDALRIDKKPAAAGAATGN